MSERATQLLEVADGQISELIGLFTQRGEAALSIRCPGREKLGDGTVAALALHTADSYLRIAGFLQATSEIAGAGASRHRTPRFLLARSHAPPQHGESGHDEGAHDDHYATEHVDLPGLLERLSAGRDALGLLTDLTDEQLDAVPPAGSFRFCDGQRTLEQVVTSLLNHQGHQLDAMKAATSSAERDARP
jgi:hypothetical protein